MQGTKSLKSAVSSCSIPRVNKKNQDEPPGRGTLHALGTGPMDKKKFPSQSQSCPFIRLV